MVHSAKGSFQRLPILSNIHSMEAIKSTWEIKRRFLFTHSLGNPVGNLCRPGRRVGQGHEQLSHALGKLRRRFSTIVFVRICFYVSSIARENQFVYISHSRVLLNNFYKFEKTSACSRKCPTCFMSRAFLMIY